MMTSKDQRQLYARVAPRLQAFVLDMLIYAGVLLSFLVTASFIPIHGVTQVLAFIALLVVVLYEPVLITMAGGTVGHCARNLRVVRAGDLGSVSFPRAVVRTIVKGAVGVPIFLVVYFTTRHQGLHDLLTGTIVIPRNPAAIRNEWFAAERLREPHTALPRVRRRITVAIAYAGSLNVLLGLTHSLLVSDTCWAGGTCSPRENGIATLLSLVSLAGIVTLAVMGGNGLLWGARRSSISVPEPLHQPAGVLPSARRRVGAILCYLFLLPVVLFAVMAFLFSEDCVLANRCSSAEEFGRQGARLAFVLVFAVIIVAGWRGYLWGARRQPPLDPSRFDANVRAV
jgi:uncharacterized RDD family membrane protein YckC